MKKWILILAAIALYQNWGKINNYFNPPPDYSAQHQEDVVLYATAWCGYCKKTRALLEQNNIAYYEYDIESSSEGNQQYRSLGGKGVPVLVVKGEVVHGFRPAEILKALNKP